MDNLIAKLYQSPKTVFTVRDIDLLWEEANENRLKSKVAYYVRRGLLLRLARGVFSKNANYSPRELATSLYTPSYISFETVLRDAGIIFQHYDTIFVAGPWTKEITIGKTSLAFRTLKDAILFNPTGILSRDNAGIATPERAFLDMIYLFPRYHFDHLDALDWKACASMVGLYGNQQLVKRLASYQKHYAQ